MSCVLYNWIIYVLAWNLLGSRLVCVAAISSVLAWYVLAWNLLDYEPIVVKVYLLSIWRVSLGLIAICCDFFLVLSVLCFSCVIYFSLYASMIMEQTSRIYSFHSATKIHHTIPTSTALENLVGSPCIHSSKTYPNTWLKTPTPTQWWT